MNGRDIAAPLAVALLLVVSLGVTGALVADGPLLGSSEGEAGDDPATGASGSTSGDAADSTDGTDDGSPGDEASHGGTGTAAESGSESVDGGSGDAAPAPASFRFDVRGVEDCGTTCRDVTVSVKNRGDTDAEDVDVKVKLLADGDEIWTGTQSYERVAAGQARTETRRVKIGYFDGARIKANDGYVTIRTTITWDGGKETFSERRQVA